MLTDGSPVVVTSHERVDGDGVGAALGLWHGLRAAGVRCALYLEPPLPAVFEFLPGAGEHISAPAELPERYHLVVVDCGSLARVGRLKDHLQKALQVVNIDHHRTNSAFGDLNYVDRSVCSSGAQIYRILSAGDVKFTPDIARCLYAAILTDTGRFSYANTTPAAFEMCARLVEAGACPWELSEQVYNSLPETVFRLKGHALNTLRVHHEGRLATMEITREMLERTGARPVDTQGFADIPVSVRGVVASALLKEMPSNPAGPFVKISLRSRPSADGLDVCSVAEALGGGGHAHAAGCEVHGSMEEARRLVLCIMRKKLEDE